MFVTTMQHIARRRCSTIAATSSSSSSSSSSSLATTAVAACMCWSRGSVGRAATALQHQQWQPLTTTTNTRLLVAASSSLATAPAAAACVQSFPFLQQQQQNIIYRNNNNSYSQRRSLSSSAGGKDTSDSVSSSSPSSAMPAFYAGSDWTSSSGLIGWHLEPTTLIGTITLQSPETYNALTVEMGREFADLCRHLERDLTIGACAETECHAVVLVGQGDDAFSAGGNIDWIKSFRNNSAHANVDLMLQFYKSFLQVRTIPVPVIAALHGPAVGAGAGLALACDLRTASVNKKRILGFNFCKLGMHSGMGASHLLPTLAGGMSSKLTEILLKGKMLSGQEAYDLGLINVLTDDAKQAAYDLALDITKQHPVAMRAMLQTIRRKQEDGFGAAIEREALAQAICYNREDWGEGVNAVAQKRDPAFDPYHSK